MHYVKDLILIYLEELKHNALLDCELLREVYINLLDVKEPKFNFSSVSSRMLRFTNKEKIYNKNILKISEEELKKHKEFLKSELKKFLLNFLRL